MGRRALPKIDPSIDFSAHFRRFEDLEPGDLQRLFPRAAPLEIEVGSGKGLFLLSAGRRHPERNFLGLENSFRYAQFCAYRAAKKKLANVRAVYADALRVFAEILPAECAADVHVYFPDPWWKKRHHKRRVVTPHFVADLERVLEPGGNFHFWTDVKEYFQMACDVVSAHSGLLGPHEVVEREPEHHLDYRTHRERRVRLEGKPVYRARFDKPA